MLEISEKETERVALVWLEKKLSKPPERFLGTELGKLLKKRLGKMGHWKNKARGKPAKNLGELQKRMGLK